jgi:transposase
LRTLSTKELLRVAARFRLADGPNDVPTATKFALRSVARRHEALSEEIAELDAHLGRLVGQAAPELLSLAGIGTDSPATLLIVAGDNPQRWASEASFANLWGVAPVEASSAKVVRHPLKRGGNREALLKRCTWSAWLGCDEIGARRNTSQGAHGRARASGRSSAASSATKPGRSTAC